MVSLVDVLSRRVFLARLPSFTAGLTFLLFHAAPAPGKKNKSRSLPPPPTDLAGHVDYLARQLLVLPLDESGTVTSQIQQLVIGHLQDWLANQPATMSSGGAPFNVQVRREMESAFSKLHYPIFGQPNVFSQSWNGGVLTGCGYTLGWSDYDRVNVV